MNNFPQTLKEFIIARAQTAELANSLNTMIKEMPQLNFDNVTQLNKKLNSEFNILLSACIKFSSARFNIPYESEYSYNPKTLILTQKPGLKAPHHSYPYTDIIRAQTVDKTNSKIMFDTSTHYPTTQKKPTINLKILKDNPQIHQDKLIKFFNLLEEYITWKNEKKNYTQDEYGRGKLKITQNNGEIQIESSNFTVTTQGISPISITNIPEFSTQKHGYYVIPSLIQLEKIQENWTDIEQCINKGNEEMEKITRGGKKILEKILPETAGFKLLKKLKTN